MDNVVNWKKIAIFATALFLAQVLVGFLEGSAATGVGLDEAKQRLVQSTLLSLLFSSAIFSFMAVRQDYRAFLHACLALLVTLAFTLALGAVLPASFSETPLILVSLGWLTQAVALVIGTAIGRYLSRRFRTPPGT